MIETNAADCRGLPAYAPMLAAYQRGHAAELRAMIAALPLQHGDRVLDMACGEGVYTCWLAERVGPNGRVHGVDISAAYLALARERAAATAQRDIMSFQTGNIDSLPFDDDTFDLVWCAQSMYTLTDSERALRELRRVTRQGGTVAIFENDTLHPLVLPSPAELELAVRAAQIRSINETTPSSAKFFIGRSRFAQLPGDSLHDRAPGAVDRRRGILSYLVSRGPRQPRARISGPRRSGAIRPTA